MKKKELYAYIQSLNSVSDLKGSKFAYTIIKNKKMVEEELYLLNDVIRPNPMFEDFERKRITLCELHSEKDMDGKPIIEEDKYKLINIELFNSELEELKNEYTYFLDERIKQIEKYNSILDEEVEINFLKIGLLDLPTNISVKELELLSFMIDL